MTYQTLSIENGLPSNKQYHVMQDTKGYIWFGTSNGACRWDSKNFQSFTIENGLPNNEVLYIFEDAKGRIWFSTFSRELSYYYEGRIYNRQNDTFLRQIDIAPGSKITEAKGELYFISYSCKLKKYNSVSHQVTTSATDKDLTGQCLLNMKGKVWVVDYKSKDGKLFSMEDSISVGDHVLSNDPDGDVITVTNYKSKKYSFRYGPDSILYRDSAAFHGFLGASYNNGAAIEIYKDSLFFKNTNRYLKAAFTSYPLIFLLKKHLFLITTGNLISCQQIPILKFDIAPGKVSNVKFLFKFKDDVYSIDAKARISNIKTQEKAAQPEGNIPYAYNFIASDSTFYLTTPFLLYYFTDPYKVNHSWDHRSHPHIKYFIPRARAGQFLSAHGRFGIYLVDLKSGYEKKLFRDHNVPVYTLFEDHSGRLWYASLSKVYVTRIIKDTLQAIKEFVLESKIPVYCKQFAEDGNGNIFFVTNFGVYVYDGKIKYKLDNTNLLTDNECNKLVIDTRDSSFWVGCRIGLNHIKYTRKQGRLQFEVINKFLETDGLYASGINDLLLDSNKLYIATEKGINVLEALNYRPAAQKIPLYIRLHAINGVNKLQDTGQGVLQLQYDQNNLTLNFSALYFLRRNRLKVRAYLFRDEKLISRSEIIEDKIDYYSLNDGKYRLVLYAYDRDYPYINGQSAPYYFTIQVPYYQSWWFIIGTSCLFIFVATAILLKRFNKRKKRALEQAELNAKLNESNLKSLQSQMNPHFVFNSLNTIQSFIVDKNERAAMDYLADFSELMREMLMQSTETTISLESEIQFLTRYVQIELIRFRNAFEVSWDVRLDDDDIADIYIPTMLIQPIIENAVKHGVSAITGRQGSIRIAFQLANKNLLQVTVADNGNAAVSRQSKGNAIAIQTIKERLRIYSKNGIKGEYHLNMTEAGATATIFIPI